MSVNTADASTTASSSKLQPKQSRHHRRSSLDTSHVCVKNKRYGWIRAELVSKTDSAAFVILRPPRNATINNKTIQQQQQCSSQSPVETPVIRRITSFSPNGGTVGGGRRSAWAADRIQQQRKPQHDNNGNNDDTPLKSTISSPATVTHNWGRTNSTSKLLSSSNKTTKPNNNIDDDDALLYDGKAITVDLSDYPSNQLPLMDVDGDTGKLTTYDDMVDLPFLHEASILYNLKERYEHEQADDCVPYTRSGDIVVAVNPYRWIKGLYSEKTRKYYARRLVWEANKNGRRDVQPHLYEASALAYKGLTMDGQNQSILVSGESGAGKTVSVKILMSHLATFQSTKSFLPNEELAKVKIERTQPPIKPNQGLLQWMAIRIYELAFGTSKTEIEQSPEEQTKDLHDPEEDEPEEMQQTNEIVQRVLDSNPLLEAFGNAKTARNDNSSRFSKYTQLQFRLQYMISNALPPNCDIAGSRCETYLLEKNRVVHHEPHERTFHIFYQLLAAPDEYKSGVWEHLSQTTASSFKYVGYTSTNVIEGLTDGRRWYKTIDALKLVGVSGESLQSLLRALCAVLQLGNLTFGIHPENEEASIITSSDELDKLVNILGVDSDRLSRAFTQRTVKAFKDTYQVPLNPNAAKDVCDAFAKAMYARTFDWLVRAINNATCAVKNHDPNDGPGTFGKIGLLDIFGFETFDNNRFEQLCINHANEKLQQKFTQDIFRSVQVEYQQEGIDLAEVHFEDNKDVLLLVEGKMGLIDILNEECIRPRGSDEGFVNKVYAHHLKKSSSVSSSPLIQERGFARDIFGIKHYAGPVIYNASKFVAKNMDTLPGDVINCALTSPNELIQSEFKALKERSSTRKGSLVAHTVWTKFRTQLNNLMDNLGKTRTRYVRCINPNSNKLAGVMDLAYTVSQLRYSGVVSAVTISRASFPNRLPFRDTLDRFHLLASHNGLNEQNTQSMFQSLLLSSKPSPDEDEHDDVIRPKVETMLNQLLKHMESVSRDSNNQEVITKAYICGKTRVYFRAGALEFLESEQLMVYDQCATLIQSQARKNIAVERYRNEIQNNPDWQVKRRPSYQIILKIFMNSLPLFIWRQFARMPTWISGGRRQK